MNGGLHSAADVTEQARGYGHGQLVEGIENRQDQCCDQSDDDDTVGDIHFLKHDLHRLLRNGHGAVLADNIEILYGQDTVRRCTPTAVCFVVI